MKYFRLRRNVIPPGIKRLFYLSWEDALWDILSKKEVKKGSTVLVPDFYCKDVEDNINKHGYKTSYYKILPSLKADKKSFANSIKKNKPAVVVVFHPVGIKSNLFDNHKWLAKIVGQSILIEDSVHRIIDSEEIRIIKKNHFIVDSLRKVVPIQGTQVFGTISDLDFDAPPFYQSLGYSIKVHWLWLLMEICWTLGFYKMAEKLMILGYETIGNLAKSSSGCFIGKLLSNHINIERLRKRKIRQVAIYEKYIVNKSIYKLKISCEDKKQLRGYPIILSTKNAGRILNCLRQNSLLVRFELEGSRWTNKRKIIYLPLGLQTNKKSQIRVCGLVNEAIKI